MEDLKHILLNEEGEYYIPPEEFEKESVKGFSEPSLKKDGIYLPNWLLNLSCLKNLELKSDYVFINGYPKSGTTWIEELVWSLTHKLDFEKSANVSHLARYVWVDRGFSAKHLSDLDPPRCLKSHLPVSFMPDNFSKIAKVVYVVRNPKDLVVSTHKFYSSFKNEINFTGSLNDMVEIFIEGKTYFGPWWEHVNHYSQLENVHIIHYEDLLEKPMETVKKLANYLDVKVSDDEIKKLIKFLSFDNMKTLPSMNLNLIGDVKDDYSFFNKGQIGNWRNYLSDEQSRKIDDMVKTRLKYQRSLQYEPNNEDKNKQI